MTTEKERTQQLEGAILNHRLQGAIIVLAIIDLELLITYLSSLL